MADQTFHSGFIAIIGRPNAGKSTLLNRILGEKIVITSDKPQTTRNRVQGIHNLPGFQIIFIDTPGIHTAKSRLNRYMVNEAMASLQEVDGVVFLVDAAASQEEQEKLAAEVLGSSSPPVILALNKIDLVEQVRATRLLERFTSLHPFRDVIALSAATGDGVESLVSLVSDLLPEGPKYFPDDILTDLPERFIAAEIIREKIFLQFKKEIPYSAEVAVESYKEGLKLTVISATIFEERETQKAIILGHHRAAIKRLGMSARRDIEDFIGSKIYLELSVKVSDDWRQDELKLKRFGYEF